MSNMPSLKLTDDHTAVIAGINSGDGWKKLVITNDTLSDDVRAQYDSINPAIPWAKARELAEWILANVPDQD